MTWRLFLVDDLIARGWGPLAVTRPAGEILFGTLLLRERLEQATGLPRRRIPRRSGAGRLRNGRSAPGSHSCRGPRKTRHLFFSLRATLLRFPGTDQPD